MPKITNHEGPSDITGAVAPTPAPDDPQPVDEAVDIAGAVSVELEMTMGGGVRTETVDDVPRGTIGQVLDWVAGDAWRAGLALEFERAQTAPRTTLVAELERIRG